MRCCVMVVIDPQGDEMVDWQKKVTLDVHTASRRTKTFEKGTAKFIPAAVNGQRFF